MIASTAQTATKMKLICSCVVFAVLFENAVSFPRRIYDERIAKLMVPLAAAAYEVNPQICVKNRFKGEVAKRIEVRCDPIPTNNCSGYVAILHSQRTIALVFRGSITDSQVNLSMNAAKQPKREFMGIGCVHSYHYGAFWSVWKGGMQAAFEESIQKFPDYKLWITGHSLGAAMSALASAVVSLNYPQFNEANTERYNFGSARVGNPKFAQNFQKLVPNFWRITHGRDLVTAIPERQLDFEFHSVEVWYNNSMLLGMPYVICKPEDDKRCADPPRDSWTEHKWYFTYLGGYARSKCKVPIL